MKHTCHATACVTEVPRERLFCSKHWYMLPYRMRQDVWRAYRPGQCEDLNPSTEYCKVAKNAVRYVAKKEGIRPDTSLYDFIMERRRKNRKLERKEKGNG